MLRTTDRRRTRRTLAPTIALFVASALACGCRTPPPNGHAKDRATKPRIGLTDTLYQQMRVALRRLGAEPVDLVTGEELKALFSDLADPLLGEASPAFTNHPEDYGGHRLDIWKVDRYETAPELDRYFGTARDDPERRLSPAFLGRLINMSAVEQRMRSLDGLLVAGGEDVDPLIYATANQGSGTPHKTRDVVELAFIGEALRQKKPLFAICRGSQILSVALGAQLIQDIPTRYPMLGKRHAMETEIARAKGHTVRVVGSSTLARVLRLPRSHGAKESYLINVNSYHHQAVAAAVAALEVGAYDHPEGAAPSTPVIEGYVVKRDHFAVGTQWHPERPLTDNEKQKATLILDPNKLFPAERPYDRAVFESFLTCARREPGCSEYLYRP